MTFIIVYLSICVIGWIVLFVVDYIEYPEERWHKKRALVKKVISYCESFPNVCESIIYGICDKNRKELFSYSSEELKKIATLDINEIQQKEKEIIAEKEKRAKELAREREERNRVIEEKRKRYNLLSEKYPDGIIIFQQRNPLLDRDEILLNENKISEYEYAYKQGNAYMFKRDPKPNYLDIKQYLESNRIKYLYHFTDRSNLESIKKNGGLYSWAFCEKEHMHIEKPGGSQLSRELDRRDGLQDYVRLTFCTDHPMMYRLRKQGYNLVLLRIKVDVAWLKDTLFSNMNATDNNSHIGGTIEDLKLVHFDAAERTYVSRDDPDFKLKQAEVLVKTCIPSRYIENLDNVNRSIFMR